MQAEELKKYLIDTLNESNKKNKDLIKYETANINWTNLILETQNKLESLKASTLILEILVYILLAIAIVISFIKIWSETHWPDLNKGAVLIILTACNVLAVFIQKIRISRLAKQILLLDILEKIDAEKTNLHNIA